jgi:hypothetical protein
VERWAVIDDTEQYRYALTRIWEPDKPRICFVMLNPSTADGYTDDPTIRKCIGFARQWDYGSLAVVNLYAFRATDPKDLWKASFPVGPENDTFIKQAVRQSLAIVAAWGASARDEQRVAQVRRLLGDANCLGKTKSGAPRHPLYVSYSRYDLSCPVYCLAGELFNDPVQ